jgi:hypothetical protein
VSGIATIADAPGEGPKSVEAAGNLSARGFMLFRGTSVAD